MTEPVSPAGPPDSLAWPAQDLPDSVRAMAVAGTFGDDPLARAASRSVDARLARIHLRGGLLPLARASLEQMAGVGALDREALADLAEARWRSGDLEGAAEAASAHLAAGGEEPIAHLIVAEEADRQGSLVDARRHAAVVRERVGIGLDRLFAGEVRSTAWPLEGVDWMDEGALGPGRWGLLAGGREVAQPLPGSWRLAPPPVAGSPVARTRPSAASPRGAPLDRLDLGQAARDELEAAEADIQAGRIGDAVDRLALVLRGDPALASVVLALADQARGAAGADHLRGLAALHLLRGDALRVLGREVEATDAYQRSMRAVAARATPKEIT